MGPYSFKKIEPGSNILYMYLFYSLVYNSVGPLIVKNIVRTEAQCGKVTSLVPGPSTVLLFLSLAALDVAS